MDGAEDEDGDGPTEERVGMGGEEAARVLVEAAHVEGATENDGVVMVEIFDFGHGLGVDDGEVLLEEVVGDGVGDFFGRSKTSGPGDEQGGGHGRPPGAAARR